MKTLQQTLVLAAVLASVLVGVSTAGAAPTVISNGQTLSGFSGSFQSMWVGRIYVPDGARHFVVTTSGGVGDCDLYIRREQDTQSIAYDINDNGVIVGASVDAVGDSRACIWEFNETSGLYEARDLNAEAQVSGFVLTSANAINNQDQIIATGNLNGSSATRAYYLDVVHTEVVAADDSYNVFETGALTTPDVGAPSPLDNDTDAVDILSFDTQTHNTRGRVTKVGHAGFRYQYNPDNNPDYDLDFGDDPFIDQFSYTATGVSGQDTADVYVTVYPVSDTFYVTQLQPTPVGFDVTFSRPIDIDVLNLYDGQDAPVDEADVTLTGSSTGQVDGSVFWDAESQKLSFIATGGPLATDSYTVTLASRSDGLVDSEGDLLDGD